MSKLQRVENILLGAGTILLGVAMMAFPESGFYIAVFILILTQMFTGIRLLVYYFTMARFMVGGRSILFRAVIVLDLAAFTYALSDIPRVYVIVYLIAYHAFAGAIDVMRAMEAKRFEAPSWKINMGYGLVNIGIAAACCIFAGSVEMIVYVYAAGLLYSGVDRIVSAFRRTAVVYIQ